MKFFAFIMAVIVLVLSAMPCTDAFSTQIKKAKIEITKLPAKQSEANDACSPFCQCTCCAGFSFYHCFDHYSIVILFSAAQQHNSFLPSEIIEISLPVWQPPKIG